MSYDAAAASEALRRPSIILHRRGWHWTVLRILGIGVPTVKYQGRLLSHVEWQHFAPRIEQLGKTELSGEEAGELLIEYCDAIRIPWKRLKHLPDSVLEEALADFFVCQGEANRRPLPTLMNGNYLLERGKSEQQE